MHPIGIALVLLSGLIQASDGKKKPRAEPLLPTHATPPATGAAPSGAASGAAESGQPPVLDGAKRDLADFQQTFTQLLQGQFQRQSPTRSFPPVRSASIV